MERMLKLNVKTMEFEEIQVPEITLKALQDGVKTKDDHQERVLIERVFLNDKFEEAGIDIFIDEEGKLKELLPSIFIIKFDGYKSKILDFLAGDVLFVGNKGEDSVGLTDEQIKQIKDFLQRTQVIKTREFTKPVKIIITY